MFWHIPRGCCTEHGSSEFCTSFAAVTTSAVSKEQDYHTCMPSDLFLFQSTSHRREFIVPLRETAKNQWHSAYEGLMAHRLIDAGNLFRVRPPMKDTSSTLFVRANNNL